MSEIKILSETDLRAAVSLNKDAVACIENAFHLLATKDVVMPPILSFDVPDHNGEVDVKTAYVPGIESFALKVSLGFFDNPMMGLPSLNGLMTLFDAKTGIVKALLLDNGYLTDIRTAAAGAVAAKHLSRENSKTAGILGSGMQARLQLEALSLVRDIKTAVIWGRDEKKLAECASDCTSRLGIEVKTGSITDVMAQADIVVTTTPSRKPLITADMIRPGQHITAMGSDTPFKAELAPCVIPAATLFVCDRLSQSIKLGELRSAIEAGTVTNTDSFAELGPVIAGQKQGRRSADDITVCDLTGTGVQDTAIATFAEAQSLAAKAGSTIQS
ncbi:Alanine dehydrogenase [Pseudovibrio axinellae]|uniref:Alanine dehydrogenase n=1 Tax=Pseudovibrio axinellae TaxID=989403 RepID=A0A165W9H0_9HYPH|nr:cyclodeaminase [Pseudovibrio axinellae]KZL16251.1 Alanine dehydrogenase [Pseudovibrio axinellae]SER79559.1 ornithine cyclodeaminase [Pseudovibrio axinellae]